MWDLAHMNASGISADREYQRLCAMPVPEYFDLVSNLTRIKKREAANVKRKYE